jgi:membrane-associated phospholipid phosphatase
MMGGTRVSNGDKEPTVPSVARRCVDHVGAAINLLLRPPSVQRGTLPFTARQAGVAATAVIIVTLALLVLVDGPVMRAAARLPHIVTWSFQQITDLGLSGWFLWPLGILFLALAALPAERLTVMSQRVLAAVMVRVGFLFLAIGTTGFVITTVKRMIGRGRPTVEGGLDPFLFHPFIWRADFASMPSGHATTAFSVLVAFGTLWPRARTALWIYALLIVVSRVVVLAHFPSDVFVGAVAGTTGALLVRRYFALRRLGFSIGPDGIPHQYPGPSLSRIKVVARELLAL